MPTVSTAPAPTMCLLHADVHVMGRECWARTLDWYIAHEHLDQHEARNAYQAAAERAMLDEFTRSRPARDAHDVPQ